VSLSPGIGVETVDGLVSQIDLLSLLGVPPGVGGQVIDPGTTAKVGVARAYANARRLPLSIAVDGSVNPDNAPELARAEADTLVIHTACSGPRTCAPV
jgi:ribulose-phosphate 3-epimerase